MSKETDLAFADGYYNGLRHGKQMSTARVKKGNYCWKCAEWFPMPELVEDDNPYIKDDPREKNYQCKKCASEDTDNAEG